MKRFFNRTSKSFAPLQTSNSTNATVVPHTPALQPKYVVPPVPHPSPYTHLALLVTDDGLLIRPHIPNKTTQNPVSHVKVSWGKTVHVEERKGDGADLGYNWHDSVIVYGILGVLELFSFSYLLVVTGRSEVGTLFEPTHAVYGLTGVTSIPLDHDRAKVALNTLSSRNTAVSRPSLLPSATADSIMEAPDIPPESGSPTSGPRVQFATTEDVKILSPVIPEFNADGLPRPPSPSPSDVSSTNSLSDSPASSPVAKVLAARLSFWNRVSMRSSLSTADTPTTTPDPAELDTIIQEASNSNEPSAVLGSILAATAPAPTTTEEKHSELEVKIVRECIREFTKGGMYFAYNFDITRSLQHKQEQLKKFKRQSALFADLTSSGSDVPQSGDSVDPLAEPYPTLPLWRRVDRQFWWNEWLSKHFIDAGLHSYVLPIMQGYYQIASFNVPPNPEMQEEEASVDYVVISRRSRDRAGLRYQRRGVDEEAHVANFVETETIMRVQREGVSNIFCYVQIRGSIPLFWTQTGYGLKPPPVLATDRTHAQNLDVMRRHFSRTIPQYGPHTIVNLAEQQGKEASLTTAYREYVTELNNPNAQYNEYDFHHETTGMKYENISKLLTQMSKELEQQGFLWISGNTRMFEQKGVFRVNCIDCLDRTNVVQSAFARSLLNRQLSAVALQNPVTDGRSEMDTVFNDVWANNGDAISRAYAGTSALKGDFTRTGRRDLTGMLNDGVNSLARMYSSTFSDWFCQAVIDFILGHRTLSVFSEFLLKLQSTDPRDLIRISKIRAEAIATSVDRVLSEGERLLGGWTLFAPEALNTKISEKFEEKVLLLTAQALYIVSYDYTLEKVKIYTRVPLGDVVSITKGAYILSPLEETSRDTAQNAGFVVTWLNENQTTRMTTYSLRNTPNPNSFSQPATPAAAAAAAISKFPPLPASLSRAMSTGRRSVIAPLSNILSNAQQAIAGGAGERTFAAFKMLPIDPTRIRRTSEGGEYVEATNDYVVNGATSCREAVDLVVETIRKACADVGVGQNDFVKKEDVVSLTEAQRMTSVYAKMEYGVKRLLWLGG